MEVRFSISRLYFHRVLPKLFGWAKIVSMLMLVCRVKDFGFGYKKTKHVDTLTASLIQFIQR
jgi:hypothetical protein